MLPPSILDIALNALPNLKSLQTQLGRKVITGGQNLVANLENRPLKSIVADTNTLYKTVWEPTEKYANAEGEPQTITTQEICDGMLDAKGNCVAALVFGTMAQFTPPLLALLPGSIPAGVPSGKTATPNADGTMMIGDVV